MMWALNYVQGVVSVDKSIIRGSVELGVLNVRILFNNEIFTRVSYTIWGAYKIKIARNNNVRNIFNAKYNQITVIMLTTVYFSVDFCPLPSSRRPTVPRFCCRVAASWTPSRGP